MSEKKQFAIKSMYEHNNDLYILTVGGVDIPAFELIDATKLELAINSSYNKALEDFREKLASELERFRDGGKLKNGNDIADMITKYVNDPRCSKEQAEKRRLLTDLEAEICALFTECADSIRRMEV